MEPGYVRRIVTGHDAEGRSIVVSDGPAPHIRTNPMRPGHYSTDIWRTNESPAHIAAAMPEPTGGPRRLMPNPNGTVVRISTIAPETEQIRNLDPSTSQKIFGEMGNSAASTFAQNKRHPLMHRTESIDYAILLEGELTMLLDEGEVTLKPGDVVVQVGTNHAWSNRSDKPARICYVLIDGKFDADLAAKFGDEGGH